MPIAAYIWMFKTVDDLLLKILILINCIFMVFIILYDIFYQYELKSETENLISTRHKWIREFEKDLHTLPKIEALNCYRDRIKEACSSKIENYILLKNYIEITFETKSKSKLLFVTPLATSLVTSGVFVNEIKNIKITSGETEEIAIILIVTMVYGLLIYLYFVRGAQLKQKTVKLFMIILEQLINEHESSSRSIEDNN